MRTNTQPPTLAALATQLNNATTVATTPAYLLRRKAQWLALANAGLPGAMAHCMAMGWL